MITEDGFFLNDDLSFGVRVFLSYFCYFSRNTYFSFATVIIHDFVHRMNEP